MARIDRVARWIAADILAVRGVEKSAASMSALLPVCYVFAAGALKALDELAGEMADELAGATAVIRVPVFAGARLDADLAAWEAEFSDDPEQPEGGL